MVTASPPQEQGFSSSAGGGLPGSPAPPAEAWSYPQGTP